MELKSFLHKHPLHFFEEWSNNVHGETRGVNCSSGCRQPISTQFYACIDCKFFLHKSCFELPLNITHPFHDNQPLTLLAKAPYRASCDFCGGRVNEFVYHCSSCKFNLDIKCALLPELLNRDFPKFDHQIHVEHPLFLIKNLSHEVKLASSRYCSVCLEQLSSDSSFYTCLVCKLFLHKSCSETERPLNISHPFHEKHTLTLTFLKWDGEVLCQFCHNDHYGKGLFYHCPSCRFNLHIKCALLPEFLSGDFPKVDHHIHVEHPLFLIKNLSHEVKLASSRCCSVCLEQLSSDSSFYTCLVCELFLHKSCSETELQLNINHPFHEKHTLTLTLLKSYSSCQFCHNDHNRKVLFYHCPSCDFKLHIKCALLPEFLNGDLPKVDHHIHVEHSLFFIKNLSHGVELSSSRYCSVCLEKLSSDSSFYTCLVCKLFLHKSCSETELPLNINHPFHEKHTLTLTFLKWDGEVLCQFCHNDHYREGLFYHCPSCRFNLHIKCALLPEFLNRDFPKVDHHIHVEHPLFFIKNLSHEVKLASSFCCSVCLEQLSNASFYTCVVCKLFLHKLCSETELPLNINHPFHKKHTLTLSLPKEFTGVFCQFCDERYINYWGYSARLFYHCSSCDFNLDIKCAFLPQFLAGNFPKRDHHFSDVDEHPLFFIQKDLVSSNKVELHSRYCFLCKESLSGRSFYYCLDCEFFVHKSCTFEMRPLKINHPLHDKHAIRLTKISSGSVACNFCLNDIKGSRYICSSCEFQLDPQCALLITKDLAKRNNHFGHVEHPLTFVQMLSKEVKINSSCLVCSNPLSGTSFYNCLDCRFFIHKKCEAQLWPKIEHVAHPEHPLILEFSAPYRASCHFCQGTNDNKIGYICRSCDFYIHYKCTLPSFFLESKIHYHQLSPFMRKNPFICDACSGKGDDARYFCVTCSLLIHKDCIFLPKLIKFKLHNRHILSHNYRFPQKEGEKWTCQFCFTKVETEYGSYKCLHSDCNYILHGSCVKKNKGRLYIEVESENEESDEASSSSSCAVVLGDKIKHFRHEHELVLDNKVIIMNGDKKCCDGCALPILEAAYSCPQAECNFSLHKGCAQIGRQKPHWAFPDPLRVLMCCLFFCEFCNYGCSGFYFTWKDDNRERICLRCSEIDFITTHEAHAQHSLFCDREHKGPCSGCGKEMVNYGGYKCTLAEEEENCKYFALDYRCLTRPLEVQHRFHHHPLKLTYKDPYNDDDDPFQHMCEICEDRRDPKLWFYRCDECDFDAHPDCVLGEFPFIKRGGICYDFLTGCDSHQRPLIYFQREKYPYPKCDECGHPCKDQLALKCPHSECNLALHSECQNSRRPSVSVPWWHRLGRP